MTAGYRLTPKARDGFRHIVFYVEDRFGLAIADRVVTDLERAFEWLADHPDVGHHREDLTRDERVRFWSVGPTLIAYRLGSQGVEALLVERGELDWERLLTEYLG